MVQALTRHSATCWLLAALGGTALAQEARIEPVSDAVLRAPPADDWLMWRRTYDGAGFSPLSHITPANVADLALVWSLPLENAPSQEGMPLVRGGTMYFPAPLDLTLALDAASGKEIWRHQREYPDDLGRFVPFPHTNRNLAIYDRLIIDNGADDTVYALAAGTGELVWETRIHDFRALPAKQGSGPIVANGLVVSGRHCATAGGPDACVLTAHDARTGEEVWRRRTMPRPGEPGDASWAGVPDDQRWQVGSWMVPSFDPALDLLYFGTSVTAPSPKYMLGGNEATYLFHNSTLAVTPASGETVWYYQHMVDHWDLDHAFERILADVAMTPDPAEVPWINPRLVPGEQRAVVTGIPGKTGLVYTLDRATGEFLWARPTIRQNVIASIDGATGAIQLNDETVFTAAGQERFVCPSTTGGKNWPAGSYDATAQVMYFSMANTCMNVSSIADKATPEMTYAIDAETVIAPGTDNVGTIVALSATDGTVLWQYEQRTGVMGLVATAGGLIFGGDVGGTFRAWDARSGLVMWETDLGAAVVGQPMVFGANGRQFIAVSTGRANLPGGLGRLTPDERAADAVAGLYVFALPD